ncbi:MAG: hypothetical protein ACRDQX_14370, partial [Pseudonocardiaceae bacterium]
MRHSLRCAAAAALVAVLGLVLPGLVLPGLAAAQSAPSPQLNVLARLALSDLSPRVITVVSAPTLRVNGQVTNIGDRPINSLEIRLQRDEPIRSDEAAARA